MNRGKRAFGQAGTTYRQRGVTTIEYALLLLPMLVLTLGGIDFGRAYFQSHVLLEAAQAGVRVAALPTSTSSTVRAAAMEVLTSAGLQAATVVSSNAGVASSRGATSSVTVSIAFHPMTGTLIKGWSGTKTLSKTAQQRHE